MHLETVKKSEEVIKYFYETFKIVSASTSLIEELRDITGTMKPKTKKEKALALLEKKYPVKDIARILNTSEQNIRNYKCYPNGRSRMTKEDYDALFS